MLRILNITTYGKQGNMKMAYKKQKLSDIISRVQGDIESRLPGADSKLARSNLNVISISFSGALKSLYDFVEYHAKQIHVSSADSEHLSAHATTWGVERKAASFATGIATFNAVNGSVLPAETIIQRSDGLEYVVTQNATASNDTLNVHLRSVEAGLNGNAVASVKLGLISPIVGIESNGSVNQNGISGGTEEESDESLRSRVIERIQTPPNGGASADYITWAKEIAGVTDAWVYPGRRGVGTVDLAFIMKNNQNSILPTNSDIQNVQNHIDTVRPVTADVDVISLNSVALDLDIRLTPDNANVRAAVELEIKDYLYRNAEPGKTLYISQIREAISLAVGESNHELLNPTSDVTHTQLQIPVFGNLTWGS